MTPKALACAVCTAFALALASNSAAPAAPNSGNTAPPPVVRDEEGNPCKGKGLGHIRNAGKNPGHDGRHDLDDGECGEEPPPSLPPDPATIAPPYTAATLFDFYAASEFLWTNVPPVQTGVEAGAVAPDRISLLRGRVLDRTGAPISGVKVEVHGAPEVGSTLSRADGVWDLAVNGGTRVTVRFEKLNFLLSYRSVDLPANDWGDVPDIVLIPLDQTINLITAALTEMQVARGSVATDDDGTRRATIFYPGSTTATMYLPGGTTQVLGQMTVRATEYTVGPLGPLAMPAELPENTGYTYAVELSIDEALAAQAERVEFSQPVIVYVENFLDFPAGEPVPNGFFDRKRAIWVPEPNGLVVKILSVTAGLADLDIDGSGSAATLESLANLGISAAERVRLASLWAPGQSLWRVPTSHFSPADFNWPYGPEPGAEAPPEIEPEPTSPSGPVDPNLPDNDPFRPYVSGGPCEAGSILDCSNQVLRERIPLTGVPHALHYASDRIPRTPQNARFKVAISGATVPPSLRRIDVTQSFQGQLGGARAYPPTPNLEHTVIWDQADRFLRAYSADSIFRLRVCYIYDAVYFSSRSTFQSALSRLPSGSGITLATDRSNFEFEICRDFATPIGRLLAPSLGGWDPSSSGLGAWTLDSHHRYNPTTGVLYLGNGTRRLVRPFDTAVYRVAGTGASGFSGDGGPARDARIGWVTDIAFGPDGSMYLADIDNNRVRKVDRAGVISTVAGNGTSCVAYGCGDGLPATEASVEPLSLLVDPDGSLVIGDWGGCIRRVNPAGLASTIYGDCYQGPHRVSRPTDLLRGPGGGLYITDSGWNQVLYIGTDGLLSEVAGDQSCDVSLSGVPALTSPICAPGGLAFDADGNLLIAGGYDNKVLRVSKNGVLDSVAGRSGINGPVGDGGPATSAQLNAAFGIAARADGSFLIADTFNGRLRRVSPHGTIETIAGDPNNGDDLTDGMHPEQLYIGFVEKVEIGPDRKIYVSDSWDPRILAIGDAGPIVRNDEYWIPSDDGGEVFVFDRLGRHQRTMHALTGSTLLTYGYDGAGRLTSIVDADGNTTVVERDLAGKATAIVGPYGQRSTMAIDPFGRLIAVTNPAGESTSIAYDGGSLFVERLTDPRQYANLFTYNEAGRVAEDRDPAGGFKQLSSGANGRGETRITVATAEGRTTKYERRIDPESEVSWTRTLVSPTDEIVTRTVRERGGEKTVYQPNGSTTTSREFTDPVWGALVRFPDSTAVSTPFGLGPTVTTTAVADLANPQDPTSVTSRETTVTVNGKAYRARFDRALLEWTFTSPAGRVSRLGIDATGRPLASQLGTLEPTRFSYDARGRLATIARGTGLDERRIDFAYDALGRLQTVEDPLLRTVSFGYNAANRVTTQDLPGSRTVQFDWDPNGNLEALTPPGKPAHLFSYTPVDLAASYDPPAVSGGGSTLYDWNLDKNPSTITRPDGATISFAYDAAQRPIAITSPRGTQTIDWEPNTGRIDKLTTPEGVVLDYTWDGPLVTQTQWSGAGISGRVNRTYDDDLRLKTISVNSANPITYVYDNDSLIKQVGAMVLTRDPVTGLLAGTSLGSVTTAYTYNSFGELETMTARFNTTTLYSEVYTRDKLGRITHRVETIQGVTTTHDYAYDAAGRLDTVSTNGAQTADYDYDLNGNRLAKFTPTTTESGAYDDQDRILSYGDATYTYTANGELETKTDPTGTTSYQYDAFGNLLGVDLSSGTQIRYQVDPRNRRVERKVNGAVTQRLLWQGQLSPIAELNSASAVVSRFVYATRINVPDYLMKAGVTYRVVTDHLGSPRLIVNTATGAVIQRMDFDEWGVKKTDTDPGFQPFGFAGGFWEASTGLVRFGARDYAPPVGRWTSRDPIGFASGSRNFFSALGSDPINRSDLSGLAQKCTRALAGAGGMLTAIYPHQGYSPGRDARNTEPLHEQFWFDDGRNAGFFKDSEVREDDGHSREEYICNARQLDDDTLWKAIEENREEPGEYDAVGRDQNNCQDWAAEVLRDYERIRSEEARETRIDPEQAYVWSRLVGHE